MKAIQINNYGSPEVLEFNENAQSPTLQPDQLLVRVHAVGLNPFDLKILSGAYKENIPLEFPVTFGGDFSGVVTQTGDEVTGINVRDEIYGTAIVLKGGSGALAEFAVAKSDVISIKPKSITHHEASALPVAGLTAVEALADKANLEPGQKVLIHGGAGGVGHFAIQFAKHLGAYVATTCSGDDFDFVRELGADEIIDYKNEDFTEKISGYDVVLDCVGGEVSDKSYGILKSGGILVLIVSRVNEELAESHGVKVVRQSTLTSRETLNRLTGLVESGAIRVTVDRVFEFSQVKEAYEYLESDSPNGKVVVKVVKEI